MMDTDKNITEETEKKDTLILAIESSCDETAASVVKNGREVLSIGADVVYAWPNATIGMMDASAAAKIMYADEIAKADDSVALINEKAAAYREMQSSALAAAKRGYVDDIIEACDTRKRVIAALEMLFTKREDRPDRKHGTV